MKPYGKIIPNLKINNKPAPYPVVNERGVRATAGIMFLIGISTFFYVFLTKNFTPMYLIVPIFWLDFFLKIIQPHYSIFGLIGDLLVKNQTPEYVGAIQKRFAWSLGLIMASTMVVVGIFMGIRGWIPFSICGICLIFMWMETALGICVGCKIYKHLLQKGIIPKPKIQPVCPGGICKLKKISRNR
jgi:hypothetical protein